MILLFHAELDSDEWTAEWLLTQCCKLTADFWLKTCWFLWNYFGFSTGQFKFINVHTHKQKNTLHVAGLQAVFWLLFFLAGILHLNFRLMSHQLLFGLLSRHQRWLILCVLPGNGRCYKQFRTALTGAYRLLTSWEDYTGVKSKLPLRAANHRYVRQAKTSYLITARRCFEMNSCGLIGSWTSTMARWCTKVDFLSCRLWTFVVIWKIFHYFKLFFFFSPFSLNFWRRSLIWEEDHHRSSVRCISFQTGSGRHRKCRTHPWLLWPERASKTNGTVH